MISDNSAEFDGGGIAHQVGDLIVIGTTISGNSAGRNGGGIIGRVSDRETIHVTNSTISGNTAGGDGGGIWVNGPAPTGGAQPAEWTIEHSTITSNRAGQVSGLGGGIFTNVPSNVLDHSIIMSNFAAIGRDIAGLLGIELLPRFSLIGSNSGNGLTQTPVGEPDANGNFIGGPLTGFRQPSFPQQLHPLADNGGTLLPDGTHVLTHALMPDSFLIDAGDPSIQAGVDGVPMHDQRGAPFTRVFGGRIDIGAFEWQPPGFLLGDYNQNGVVDAADYSVWRDAMGSSALAAGTGADGNGDGVVDSWDYRLWKSNFGATVDDLPQAGGAAQTGGQSPFSLTQPTGQTSKSKMGTDPDLIDRTVARPTMRANSAIDVDRPGDSVTRPLPARLRVAATNPHDQALESSVASRPRHRWRGYDAADIDDLPVARDQTDRPDRLAHALHLAFAYLTDLPG
jgi:hypothetical protein